MTYAQNGSVFEYLGLAFDTVTLGYTTKTVNFDACRKHVGPAPVAH